MENSSLAEEIKKDILNVERKRFILNKFPDAIKVDGKQYHYISHEARGSVTSVELTPHPHKMGHFLLRPYLIVTRLVVDKVSKKRIEDVTFKVFADLSVVVSPQEISNLFNSILKKNTRLNKLPAVVKNLLGRQIITDEHTEAIKQDKPTGPQLYVQEALRSTGSSRI